MKNIFFVLSFFVAWLHARSQVTMQPVLPSGGIIQKTQLWNVVLVNSSATQYNCRLNIILRDRVTNTDVLSASSNAFLLAPGAKQVNLNSLGPVQYNYLVPVSDLRLQGLIPVGSYTACYSLTTEGDKATGLAEECSPFDIEPLGPPLLISPADSSILDVSPAQFTWLPPSPENIFSGLNYEILIAPLNEGQKPEEALQQNIPLFSQTNLQGNLLNYSGAYPAFEKDKWYAWQVTAKDDKSYAAKTETWIFKLSSKAVSDIISQTPYVRLTQGNNELAVAPNGILKIFYKNEDNAPFVMVDISAISKKGHAESTHSFRLSIKPGENYIQYDLGKIIKPEEGKVYQAQIVNKRGEKFSVQFVVKNFNSKN